MKFWLTYGIITVFFCSYYSEAAVLEFIDDQLAKFWHIVLVGLCKLTGRDNYFFAAVFEWIAATCYIVAITYATRFNGLAVVPARYFFCNVASRHCDELKKMREAVESGDHALPLSVYTNPNSRVFRLLLTLNAPVFVVLFGLRSKEFLIPSLLLAAGSLLQAAASYFAIDVQKPQKNIFAKVADWLKAHRPEMSWGGLTPHPFPV